MKEILLTLLQAVLVIAVPVITAYVTQLIKAASAKTENEYIQQIAQDVADAVTFTSQTYVDTLKKAGEFKNNEEAQAEAAEKALDACMGSLSNNCRKYLERVYGDYSTYLMTKIEAEVRRQKTSSDT